MISLLTINDEDPSKSCKIATFCEEDTIHVTIIKENLCYEFKILECNIKKFSSMFEMDNTVYKTSLMTYISSKRSEISFDISKKEFVIYKNNNTKYFYCDMKKVDYVSTMNSILERCSHANSILQNNVNLLESELQKCQNDSTVYQTKLEEYIRDNAEHENKLYSHFTHLLNEKKKRIQYLNDVLSTDRASDSVMSVPSIIKKQKVHHQADVIKDVTISNSDSESISDNEYNTDNEESYPSTSKQDGDAANLPQHIAATQLQAYDVKKTDSQIDKTNNDESVVLQDNDISVLATATISTQDLVDFL